MRRSSTPLAGRGTWSPGWRLRTVLLATSAGSLFGLVFGLASLNRPILNAAVFYVVGALVAALVTGLAVLAVRSRPRRWAAAGRLRRRARGRSGL